MYSQYSRANKALQIISIKANPQLHSFECSKRTYHRRRAVWLNRQTGGQTDRWTNRQPHRWTSVAAYRAEGHGQTQIDHGRSLALPQMMLSPFPIGRNLAAKKHGEKVDDFH